MRLTGQPPIPGPGPPLICITCPPGPTNTPLPPPGPLLPEPMLTRFTTTRWPAVRPLVIWVSPLTVSPVVTVLVTWRPFTITWTTVFPPGPRRIAADGTASASATWWEMIVREAEVPAYRPDGVPVTSITTGNVGTPELVSAVRPIEATVPVTGPLAPSVVITTGSPVLMWSTTLALTLALTTSLALITVIDVSELPESLAPAPLSP